MSEGATANERFISACRTDSLDLLSEVLNESTLDVNCTDAMGNPGIHICIQQSSTEVLEKLLTLDNFDVDQVDRMNKNTALHVACLDLEDIKYTEYIVDSLLKAGADPNITNKEGMIPKELLPNYKEDAAPIKKLLLEASTARKFAAEVEAQEEDSDDEGASSE
ncbi:ankyrin [Neoconidiobolus thromboides FSU 785]|nr:ankyrin [Neoconidiobolus thromboides FSU 785]